MKCRTLTFESSRGSASEGHNSLRKCASPGRNLNGHCYMATGKWSKNDQHKAFSHFFAWFRMFSTLGGNFGPEKKYLAPPPQFPANTLPAPRPPGPHPPGRPPPLGFSIKISPPDPPGASDSAFPSPEQKKIKNIRNVHQGLFLLFFARFCTFCAVCF